MQQNNKFGYNMFVSSTGVLVETEILDDDKIRFATENAGASNEFEVSVKLKGQSNWNLIKTITGISEVVAIVDTYDEIKVECTVLDGSAVKLLASGFRNEC